MALADAQSKRIRKTTLFVDMLSQPSRACVLFSRLAGLQVEEQLVIIGRNDQRKPEHLKCNPLGKVPALTVQFDDDSPPCNLPESCAIITYLAAKFPDKVAEHWLPRTNLEARAHVEAALHWYHNTVRAGCARIVMQKVLIAKRGLKPNEAVAQEGLVLTRRALLDLQDVWLQAGTLPFIGGARPCVADLLVVCELEQLTMLNKERDGVDMHELLAPHPIIRRWMASVAEATAPHYEQVHVFMRRFAAAEKGTTSPAQQLAQPHARL